MRKIVSGIYQIVNTQNGHKYIGSSKDTYKRWQGHRQQLLRNKHHSPYLQRAWNLYGETSFIFEIIEECAICELITREQYYIDTIKPEYNISPTASSRQGVRMTIEAIARMAERLRGVKHTPEQNQRKSERQSQEGWREGFKHTEETKKLIGKKGEGRIPTNEARLNMADAARKAWAEGRRKGEKHKNKRKSQKNCEETADNAE